MEQEAELTMLSAVDSAPLVRRYSPPYHQHDSSHTGALPVKQPLLDPTRTPRPKLAYRYSSRHLFTPPGSPPLSLKVGPPTPSPPAVAYSVRKPPAKNQRGHVPIVCKPDTICSVLKEIPEGERSRKNRQSASTASSGLSGSVGESLHSQQSSIPIKSRPTKHVPIVIPAFARPSCFPDTPVQSFSQVYRSQNYSSYSFEVPPDIRTPPLIMSRPTTAQDIHSVPLETTPRNDMYTNNVNSSQSSLASEAVSEVVTQVATNQRSGEPTPLATGNNITGNSISMSQSMNTSMQAGSSTAQGSTSLSGLVANVHRCTGKEPHALVGATTTVLGDKLYVFGGRTFSRRRPHLSADLYELDLLRRHWTKLETTGTIPAPRYFHSMCALGDNKLICYGGMSPPTASPTQQDLPEVVVMSDIHIYDVKTRVWTYIATSDNPQGRYAHCATVLPSSGYFTSQSAPLSAIHHNPSSSNPNQGSIGVQLDGTGGAEMVVVGGQDSANHYIEQISVFNLRSLKWTATQSMIGRSCGAYRSVVAPLIHIKPSKFGAGIAAANGEEAHKEEDIPKDGSAMLIYSNYNFLDVKLELQIRSPDGSLTEKQMQGQFSPPGLRFPNGDVLDNYFVVSGTYLTSSKQEYAIWALDLRTLTWSRIDAGGNVFSTGSWNRGVLWARRNAFVVLGNRKRNLVEDYNHRRINFSNICLVELEAFGLYENPRHAAPMSSYQSFSVPNLPPSLRLKSSIWSGGGRPHSKAAGELGTMALGLRELSDMDIISITGERIPANSQVLSKRWGPYFVQLLREGSSGAETVTTQASALRNITSGPSRNSSITITPSISTTYTAATLTNNTLARTTSNTSSITHHNSLSSSSLTTSLPPTTFHPPTPTSIPAHSRSRSLFLPHTPLTIHALLHYVYTSSLPPTTSPLSTPQILCSLLQLARPYRIDGLLEAVVQRLHEVMDGRNAAAVFNASAMAAGGGRGTGFDRLGGLQLPDSGDLSADHHVVDSVGMGVEGLGLGGAPGERNTVIVAPSSSANSRTVTNGASHRGHRRGASSSAAEISSSEDEGSVSGSISGGSFAGSEYNIRDSLRDGGLGGGISGLEEEIWSAERSCVVGLQKRGLKGLMEGRRMRERGRSGTGGAQGIASAAVGPVEPVTS